MARSTDHKGIHKNKNVKPVPMPRNPVGRPTKYKPKFCEKVQEVGRIGGWVSEMAEACDVHRSSLDEWAKEHPEFSAALNRAKQLSQLWFEQQGRENLKESVFQANLWHKQMQARFRDEYTDQQKVTHEGGFTVNVINDFDPNSE